MKTKLAGISAFIGMLLIMGAVGTDDYYTVQGIYHSINYVQIIVGLIMLGWPALVKKYD